MNKVLKAFIIFIAVLVLLTIRWVPMWPVLVIVISFIFIIRTYFSKKSIPDILLLICSVAISLSLGEIVFRVRNDYPVYGEAGRGVINRMLHTNYTSPFEVQGNQYHTFQPHSNDDYSTPEFIHHRHTNSLGLNDIEWTPRKKKIRIACIGDSYTEGVGATKDSTYERILESITDAEVMNCGLAGSDPFFEYMLFKEKILKTYKPDIVIVAINYTDLYDVMTRGGFERFLYDGEIKFKQGPWWEGVYGVSFMVRSIVHKIFRLDTSFHPPQELTYEKKETVEYLKDCMNRFQDLAQENGIKCIFMFHPSTHEIVSRKLDCAAILEYAQRRRYSAINVLNAFIEQGVNEKNIHQYFWTLDGHNKNEGYKVIAQKIKADLSI